MRFLTELRRRLLRRYYILTGDVHRDAVFDPATGRVYAKNEHSTINDKSYWAWVDKTFPHAITVEMQPYDEEMHNWFIQNRGGLWHMRRTLFRAQVTVDYATVIPLTNVFFFGLEQDAIHFRLRWGGRVGNHYDVFENADVAP